MNSCYLTLVGLLLVDINYHNVTAFVSCAMEALEHMSFYFWVRNDICIVSKMNKFGPDPGNRGMGRRYGSSRQYNLISVQSGNGVSVYELLTDSKILNNADTAYRSPILQEWDHLKPFKILLMLYDNVDRPPVRLMFGVDAKDDLSSWFKQDSLIWAYPWNLTTMKELPFNFFSLSGYYRKSQFYRRFYINLNMDNCTDEGLMGIFEGPDPCQYIPSSKPYPQFGYVYPDTSWRNVRFTEKFRMLGYYNVDIYSII